MKPPPRLWLRAPVGGHSGPRGITLDMLERGWSPFFSRLRAIVDQAKPGGVVISNPWGESPGPMRIDAYSALLRDHPHSPLCDLTTFAEGVADLAAAVTVAVYLGGWAGPRASLRDLADAYDVGLDRLPRECIPIIDAAGDAVDFAGPLADTMASKGFARWGYEPQPKTAPVPEATICLITAEWFQRHLDRPGREPVARLPSEVLVQCEPPLDDPRAVGAILARGFSVLVEAYRWREYANLMPAPDDWGG